MYQGIYNSFTYRYIQRLKGESTQEINDYILVLDICSAAVRMVDSLGMTTQES